MKLYLTGYSSVNPFTDSIVNRLPGLVEEKNITRLSCIEPDYKLYITDPAVRRRLSRAVRFGVASAMQCVERAGQQPDAIITATGLGCLGDTEKFLRTILQNDEQFLNPTPFIQSTFNTVGAQVAMLLKSRNYNMTYVHRGFSFENALLDTMMKLRDHEAEHILVGSYEETTDTSFDIMSRLGFWRHGVVSGEGAQFFMVSSLTKSSCILKDIATIYDSSAAIVTEKFRSFLSRNLLDSGDIDLLVSGENTDPSDQIHYQAIEDILDTSSVVRYKHLSGEYPTVSSFALWLSVEFLRSQAIPDYLIKKDTCRPVKKILIYNHFKGINHSFLLLENAY